MKKIDAIVRVNKIEEVKAKLEEAGIAGMTTETVRGHGRQQGRTELYRGSTYSINLLPKARIEVVVRDDQVDIAIAAIMEAAQTGEIGDGKVFVTDIIDAIRIRTGERGEAAL
ncbi:MAG: P-II family nitrogen regulator [Fimbriimonadales bacterium]|nr:P-II family nitrogen regulator [Fimbriimonadales bacterium]